MSGGWNTIESDAGVFTYLVDQLGVKDVQFEELISLDADLLRELNPIYGVIFLFKYPTSPTATTTSTPSTPIDGTYDPAAASTLFFASQTIQNACGTQALLSVLLNSTNRLDIGPQLHDFLSFTQSFPPDLRGETLSNSDLIRSVHNSFARASPFIDETQRPGSENDNDDPDVYHFIAYVPINGSLYELDGLQPAPINHGLCAYEDFPEVVMPVLRRRVERYPGGEIRFNLLAMVRDLRIRAREAGDRETVLREIEKRKGWQWENALRRHNMVGFVGEVAKGVVRERLRGGAEGYEMWVDEARARTEKRRGEKAARGGLGHDGSV